MQRSGYSTSTHSKSGTDRNRIATTSSGITLDNIYQIVSEAKTKFPAMAWSAKACLRWWVIPRCYILLGHI